MEVSKLVIGSKYRSTAFRSPITLVSIDRVEDGVAVLTVLYRGKLYCDFSFSLMEV